MNANKTAIVRLLFFYAPPKGRAGQVTAIGHTTADFGAGHGFDRRERRGYEIRFRSLCSLWLIPCRNFNS
jgi:hypothetical protein